MSDELGAQLRAVSRRTFLRNAALASALLPGAGALLASCGGGGGEAEDGELAVPRVLLTSPTQPSYVETVYGPVEYGKDFGLPMTSDDFKEFDSHATAMQALLSGRGDIIGGSMISHLIIQSRGEDIKVFCPFVNLDDFVLAGSSGVTEMKQLTDPSTRVAVDSPGGAGEGILNAMLDQAGLEATVDDLPNAKILESSDLRTSAWASGDVDATIIHLVQYQDAAKEVSDPTIISRLWTDIPLYIKEAYAAPANWLEENPESAAAFSASVIKASRELVNDFDQFASAVQEHVEEPPSKEELEPLFPLIKKYDFWPQDGRFDAEAIAYMIELAEKAENLEEPPSPGEVVDEQPVDAALKLLKKGG